MSNPTKIDTYILARLGGDTDEEANEKAGYSGRTPGYVIQQYVQAQQVLDDINTWGHGPGRVSRERELCQQQLRNVQSLLREYQIKAERLAAQLRAIRQVESYRCVTG